MYFGRCIGTEVCINMEILIISDSLMEPVSNDIDNFKCINWESQTIGPLSHYDAIIIDMTFGKDDKEKPSRNIQRLLYDLSRRLPDSNFLDDGPTIIAVICSSEEEAFNAYNRPDEHTLPENWESEPFTSYEFLKQIMSDHEKNCYYEEIEYRFITPLTPSSSYLLPIFLCSKIIFHIFPITIQLRKKNVLLLSRLQKPRRIQGNLHRLSVLSEGI